jgi:hypothetical protein
MGSIITNKKFDPNKSLCMSNGLTAVFIQVICLAGSDTANNNHEKDLMIWFAKRDPFLVGMGFEGFDLQQIIWEKGAFQAQKEFLLKVIESAKQKTNWEKLDYSPKEDWVLDALSDFIGIMLPFEAKDIDESMQFEIINFKAKYKKCTVHGIYLHAGGCVICNNT